MSKQEDFHQEVENQARILKEPEMKRKFNRNKKRLTP